MTRTPSTNSRKKTASLQVRIIGGKWRGRKLHVSGSAELRPTPARSRETLFNWLRADLSGSHCLDLFAGSGVLGLESLSLSARQVTLVERHAATCRSLAAMIDKLDAADHCNLVRMDAIRFLKQLTSRAADDITRWDIIYLDPPFQQPQLLDQAMQLISQYQLATRYVYLEAAAAAHIEALAERCNMLLHRRMRSGDSHAALLIPQAARQPLPQSQSGTPSGWPS